MEIYTTSKEKIRTRGGERPEWNDYHKRYYVTGYRWVKGRRAWSRTAALHSFEGYSEDPRCTYAAGQ
jgi:hypothetical protein